MHIDKKLGIETSNLEVLPNDPALQLVRNCGNGQTFERGEMREVEGGFEQHIYDWSTGKLWFTAHAKTKEDLKTAVVERAGAIISTARRLYKKSIFESENIDKPEVKEPQLTVVSRCSVEELLAHERLIQYNRHATSPWDIQLCDKILDIDEGNLYYPGGCRVVNICSFDNLTIGYYYASDAHHASFAPREHVYYALKAARLIKKE